MCDNDIVKRRCRSQEARCGMLHGTHFNRQVMSYCFVFVATSLIVGSPGKMNMQIIQTSEGGRESYELVI